MAQREPHVAGNSIRLRTAGQYPFFLPIGAVFICPAGLPGQLGQSPDVVCAAENQRAEKTLTLTPHPTARRT